jgi:micrococcal nuclease
MKIILTLIVCFVWCMPVLAYPAVVVRVIDGDTIVLNNGTHIRLAGIDAPELHQPYGPEARQELERICLHSPVDVLPIDKDRYKRTIAWIELDFNVRKDRIIFESVNAMMVVSGNAWHYSRYDDSLFLSYAQEMAQSRGYGLWETPGALPPWDFRKIAKLKHRCHRLGIR